MNTYGNPCTENTTDSYFILTGLDTGTHICMHRHCKRLTCAIQAVVNPAPMDKCGSLSLTTFGSLLSTSSSRLLSSQQTDFLKEHFWLPSAQGILLYTREKNLKPASWGLYSPTSAPLLHFLIFLFPCHSHHPILQLASVSLPFSGIASHNPL